MIIEQSPYYFEPNHIDFDVEDLSIGVALEVLIPSRGLTNGESFKSGNVTIFNNDDDALSTSYSDVTFMELHNGGNKESIGIENINIKYNSWYFPEVNIKFIDVRGNSVFNSMEMTNDEETKETAEGSFLQSLFTFPYPIFKLTVKGYYGKPITYQLTVRDVRAQFNSNTGNFEMNVNFIGHMYSYLTDIPMSLLFAAPYINYNNISNDIGNYTGTNNKIPTFIDFIKEASNALNQMSNDSDLKENNEKLQLCVELKDIINKVKEVSVALHNNYVKKYFTLETQSNDKCTFKLKENDTDDSEYKGIDIASEMTQYINEVREKWYLIVGKCQSIDLPVDDLTCVLAKNEELTLVKGSGVNATIVDDYGNVKESFELYYNYDNDMSSYNNISTKLGSIIQNLRDDNEKKKKEIYEESFKFLPTLKNVVEMTLAHMNKFHENMSSCLANIQSNSTSRKLSAITGHTTDCNSNSNEITVYPFPAFYDKNNCYSWIGDTAAWEYDETNFIKNIAQAVIESTKKISEVVVDYETKFEKTNNYPLKGIPVLFSDLTNGNVYRNILKSNTQTLEELIVEPSEGGLPYAFKILAYRYVLWKLFNQNNGNNISLETFGKLEALNMLSVGYTVDMFKKHQNWREKYQRSSTNTAISEFDTYTQDLLKKVKDSFVREEISINDTKYSVYQQTIDFLEDIIKKDEKITEAEKITEGKYLINYPSTPRLLWVPDCYNETLEDEYNNMMQDVNLAMFSEGIDTQNYIKSFPRALSEVPIFERANEIFSGESINPTFMTFDESEYENDEDEEGYSKILVGKILNKGKNDKALHRLVFNDANESDGEYGFDTIDSYDSWVDDITDFYPMFDTEHPYYSGCTMGTFETVITNKKNWRGKERKVSSKVFYSFSCIRYWEGDLESIDDIKQPQLERAFEDFFTAIGFKGRVIDLDKLIDIHKGIVKIPKVLLMYIGYYLSKRRFQPADFPAFNIILTEEAFEDKKISFFSKAIKYYEENWEAFTKSIISNLLSKGTISDGYSDIKFVTNKNNKSQFFFRKLDDNVKDYLKTILNDWEYLFSCHGDLNTQYKTDESHAIVLETFIKTVSQKCGLTLTETTNSTTQQERDLLSADKNLGIYDTVKNLYDRWKYGAEGITKDVVAKKITIDNFIFRDALNVDNSDELDINVEKLINLISSVYKGGTDMSVYNFLYEVCSYAGCLLLALPANIFDMVNSDKKLNELFTPYPYSSLESSALESTFVITYRQKDSQHLNFSPNVSAYKDDSIDFTNFKYVPRNNNTMGVFGVTYGLGSQRFFKDIQVNMDKPKVTEQSISSTLYIAEHGSKNGSQRIGQTYHDVFDTYSNHSYHCTVTSMGNAQIMPMMYFQLNNIPLFKGGYQIINVEHTINQKGMTTTFVGNRLNRYSFDLSNKTGLTFYDTNEDGSVSTSSKQGGFIEEDRTIIAKMKRDEANLTYSKEKTLIIIDAGHNMKVSGKESPLLHNETAMFNQYDDEKSGDGVLNPYDINENETYRYREYWGNRKIASQLVKKLKDNNFNVKDAFNAQKNAQDYSGFTRIINDEYETWKGKGGSVIVISIHSNAGTDGSWGNGNRWEIYKQSSEYVKKDNKRYYAPHPNTSEKLAENIAKAASKIFKELGDKAPSVNGKKIKVETKPKTFNERETEKGIRPTTFSKAPAVLSENLFHDTKEHVQFLASKEGRDAIVNLHYEGIVNFFNEMANNN